MEQNEIVYKTLDEIVPYQNNPRRNKRAIAKVADSIKRYGFLKPIEINTDGVIINGHTRLEAAKKLGLTEVPCIVVDGLTPEQQNAYRLVDNKTQELAEWDAEKLTFELANIEDDMLAFGFVKPATGGIFQDGIPLKPSVPFEPRTGDLLALGRHRIMVSPCMNEAALAAVCGEKKANLIFCMLPGNAERETLAQELLTVQQFVVSGAVFYLWHDDVYGQTARGACRDAELEIRQVLVFDEHSSVSTFGDGYTVEHRPCLYGWVAGSHLWASDRKQTTILSYDAAERGSLSVPLSAYCIENNTRRLDSVLDPYGENGSTIIACEQCGRTALCVCGVKDARIAMARFISLTGDASLVRRIHEQG